MPTLQLFYNISNTIPATTDPLHYRSYAVDYVDDRKIKEIKVQTKLLNQSVVEDIIGIQRKLTTFLRTSDIKSNIDFLTSFFNSPYKWALVGDVGYYFNAGTLASPVAVPVVSDKSDLQLSVSELSKTGILLITSNVYGRPSAPTAGEIDAIDNGTNTNITCTKTKLKMRVYKSDTSGGTYVYIGESTSNTLNHVVTGSKYYKVSAITIGSESELSPYVLAHGPS